MKADQNHIFIKAPYHEKQNLLRLGGSFSQKENAWKFPKSIHALEELESTYPKLKVTDTFQTIKRQIADSRERLRQLKNQPIDRIQNQNQNLRTYQLQDVEYLKHIPSAGVFNQPRTGKTPTIICTLVLKQTEKNVIICPAALQLNWIKELQKWTDQTKTEIIQYTGSPAERKKILLSYEQATNTHTQTFLVMSKDVAKRDADTLCQLKIDALVIDEAHYLRNRKTSQTQAIYALGKKSKHRYALTGTPTVKHPADIFGIMHFLYPDKFSSYWQFVERYFQISDNGFGKEIGKPIPHRQAELQDLIDAISTQRLRKDVMQWLPDKERHTHICEMGDKQHEIYNQLLDDFFVSLDGVEIDTSNVLSQLMRLRQICQEPKLLNLNIPSAKTEAVIQAIEDDLYTQPGEPIVIMSMFTSYLNLLKPMIEKLGKRVGMITGQLSNADKEGYARAFQRGEIDVLLCNIISAGTGFTLDKGEVVFFLDKAWNPSDNEQAEDRVTPTQQDRNHKHFIVSFVCVDTIDQRINAILDKKENLTSFINQCKHVDEFRLLLL